MIQSPTVAPLLEAVERYFTLMYDNDVSQFDRVFAPTAQLHGFRDAELRILPVRDYRAMLASAPSPQSKNAPRLQEILLIDLTSRRRPW
ncbi:nuclear transport factor 2 family protein [Bradyrhizobium sp. 18BD]